MDGETRRRRHWSFEDDTVIDRVAAEERSLADLERYRRFVTWDHDTLARMAAQVVGKLIELEKGGEQ